MNLSIPDPDPSLPKAASAWIIHESGLVLAVSRKHDDQDLGLAGGKLDPGESFEEAVVRETKEETNLDVVALMPLYAAPCGTPGVHHVHWCKTFLCKVQGTAKRMEKGKVLWVLPRRLVTKPDGTFNSFGEYNSEVQNALKEISEIELAWFRSSVSLDPEFIL